MRERLIQVTRQEFAATVTAVRAGERGATLKLWKDVRRFVSKAAYRWADNSGGRIQHEDLMQAGFLAVLDAVERFDPERENGSFLSVLRFTLKTRFAEESSIRTTKRDALHYAESADAPVYRDEEGLTVADIVPSGDANLAFAEVEYGDFLRYCRCIIGAALDSLTPVQADVVRLHYLDGLILDEVAELHGLSSKQAVSETEERALDRLARGKYRRELRECLWAFEDFRAIRDSARADLWSASRTEKAALRNIEKEMSR